MHVCTHQNHTNPCMCEILSVCMRLCACMHARMYVRTNDRIEARACMYVGALTLITNQSTPQILPSDRNVGQLLHKHESILHAWKHVFICIKAPGLTQFPRRCGLRTATWASCSARSIVCTRTSTTSIVTQGRQAAMCWRYARASCVYTHMCVYTQQAHQTRNDECYFANSSGSNMLNTYMRMCACFIPEFPILNRAHGQTDR